MSGIHDVYILYCISMQYSSKCKISRKKRTPILVGTIKCPHSRKNNVLSLSKQQSRIRGGYQDLKNHLRFGWQKYCFPGWLREVTKTYIVSVTNKITMILPAKTCLRFISAYFDKYSIKMVYTSCVHQNFFCTASI